MTEENIIDLLNARDETAISALMKYCGGLALSVAMRILDDRQDAEECVQDALMAVWNSIPPQRPASLRSYFVCLVRNRAITLYHTERRQKRGGGETPLVLEELSAVAGPDSVEDEVAAKELKARINDFLAGLPRRERDVFLRRYFFFDPIDTVAGRFGLSPHYVSVLLHRTRKKLKQFLKKEDLL